VKQGDADAAARAGEALVRRHAERALAKRPRASLRAAKVG
jgi:hypothetical protein